MVNPPNDGIIITGSVDDWRNLSFFAEMVGQRRFADKIWQLVANMRKDRVRRIEFHNYRLVALVRQIRDEQNLGFVEVPP